MRGFVKLLRSRSKLSLKSVLGFETGVGHYGVLPASMLKVDILGHDPGHHNPVRAPHVDYGDVADRSVSMDPRVAKAQCNLRRTNQYRFNQPSS